ncbi:MAG: hypothetical protein H6Q89_1548 [Myxococcaceae bacterium]|nr:hypothetical protein [Myxococcaceae bacterium]
MEALNLMTLAVTTIPSNAPLEQAHALMLRLGVRHLPVLTGGRLAGILSDRDVLLACSQSGDHFVYPAVPVGEKMASAPVTAGIHTPVAELANLMLEHKIDAIPILSHEGELIGLVTSSDLLRVVGALPDSLSLHLPPYAGLANGAAR